MVKQYSKSRKNTEGVLPIAVSKQVGQPRLSMSKSFVEELSKEDLKNPNRFFTYDEMELDPAVSLPYELTRALQTIGISQGSFVSTGTRTSDILADFGNYNLHSMTSQTWIDVVNNMNTHIKNGFSLGEIVVKKAKEGPYKGSFVLDAIGPMSPKSVYAWVWDEYQREVTHVVQKPLRVTKDVVRNTATDYKGNIQTLAPLQTLISQSKYPVIPVRQLLHCRYNPSFNDPQGNSAFNSAYTPWQEKIIVGKYQIIGVTRDLGGTGLLRLDKEFMKKALDTDNKYPEDRKAYEEIKTNMENMTAGEQAFFILSSEIAEGSSSVYSNDLKLIGVEGGGKQFDTKAIIECKINEIHNAFGAGFLGLGQNGQTGAYNLATSGMTIHQFFVQRDLISTCEVIRRQILVRLLEANNIKYSHKDLPIYKYKDPDELSMDEFGKAVQRIKSVNGLTEKGLEHLYKLAGFPVEGIDRIDFDSKGQSRSGDSKGSSGTGNSQLGGAASAVNVENKQLLTNPLNLVAEDQGDKVALVDNVTGNIFKIVDKL